MKSPRRLIPDMNALQSFSSAAHHLSFTRAAEELHLTQSSISRHIAQLEAQLGVALFRRVRRQVVLTPAGIQFHREVAQILRLTERTMVRAVNTGDRTEVLRLATLSTFGSRWLIPRLREFCDRYPQVQIDLFTYAEPFSLTDENCDLAFHYGEPHWPQGNCTYLCSEVVLPVASPAYAAPDAGLSGLRGMALLQNASRPLQWQEWHNHTGLDDSGCLSGPRFDSFAGIIAAAMAGLGVALLPTYLIEDELASGQLGVLADLPLESHRAYYMVESIEGARSNLIDSFKAWALASVGTRRPQPPQSRSSNG